MNRDAIWAIVGLMGAALLAIILLQAYWINGAITLNESQFDKQVQDALNQVAIGLKEFEEEELDSKRPISRGELTMSTIATATASASTTLLKSDDLFINRGFDVSGLNQGTRGQANIIQDIYKTRKPENIEDRIDRKYLRDYLARELSNRGINIGYEYGVLSHLTEQIVIKNGKYLISGYSEEEATEITDSDNKLIQSKYEVELFSTDIEPPGKLVVYFPQKSSVVWGGNVWRTLIAAFISTVIVICCFLYTVNVIFTQKKLSEMKTDFINNMTHEFKTPIATISLAADSITNPMILSNEDKIKRFAKIIKQENKRMNNQVEKVLQMASLDKEDFDLNITSLNLHEIIEQAVTNAKLQVAQKDGEVTTNLKAKDAYIEGDLTHISNIINNLLDNANKYSPENPKISVHTRNVRGGVEVIVSDQGIGMSKDVLKHIFDKFYRVHTGNLHDVKGFGLGLSYVKAMMVAHKGKINVKSDLGKGSTFILTFSKKFQKNA